MLLNLFDKCPWEIKVGILHLEAHFLRVLASVSLPWLDFIEDDNVWHVHIGNRTIISAELDCFYLGKVIFFFAVVVTRFKWLYPQVFKWRLKMIDIQRYLCTHVSSQQQHVVVIRNIIVIALLTTKIQAFLLRYKVCIILL